VAEEALLDTSVWIGLFVDDARIAGLREAQGPRTAVASSIVLAELQSLSAQGRVRADAARYVMESARIEPLSTEDALEGGRLHGQLRTKGKSKVSMADALMLAKAHRLGIPFLTLDADLRGERSVTVL
jgi:predicted nucleic acid-binding protein